MIKFLMSLIAIVASFIGLIGTTNSALATPLVNNELATKDSDSNQQLVSLNVSNSLWQLGDVDSKNIFDHLGCSCAACSQTVETNL